MLLTGTGAAQDAPLANDLTTKWKDASVYAIAVKHLDGTAADFKQFEGKVAILVNTASQCGLTPQYAALEALAAKYKDRGVVVLGFPSADFGGQEFDSAKEIREFCDSKYKITFPLFEKCHVKAGAGQSPVFECLSAKTGKLPSWNFGKYIISKDGKSATFFDSRVAPDSKLIEAAILACLNAKS
ncbi:MAG: glutathione peroxidase [Phycisphaerales bacterium]|nr:glutathione peroxidase [Phycisphaerales bacterium]